jgi:hypothetical protein
LVCAIVCVCACAQACHADSANVKVSRLRQIATVVQCISTDCVSHARAKSIPQSAPTTSKRTYNTVVSSPPTQNVLHRDTTTSHRVLPSTTRKHRVWSFNTSSVATEDSSQRAGLMRCCLQCPVAWPHPSHLTPFSTRHTEDYTRTHDTLNQRFKAQRRTRLAAQQSIDNEGTRQGKQATHRSTEHPHPHTHLSQAATHSQTHSTLLAQIPHSDSPTIADHFVHHQADERSELAIGDRFPDVNWAHVCG